MTDIASIRQGASTPSMDGPPILKLENPGDEILGEVTRATYDKVILGQENAAHIFEVNDEFRNQAVTFFATDLQLRTGFGEGRNNLGRRPLVGDKIYARYDGKQPLDGGRTMKLYGIFVVDGQSSSPAAPAQVAPPQVQQPVQQAPQFAQPTPQPTVQPGFAQPAPQPTVQPGFAQPAPQPSVQQQAYANVAAQQAPPQPAIPTGPNAGLQQPPAGWTQPQQQAQPQQGQQHFAADGSPVPF